MTSDGLPSEFEPLSLNFIPRIQFSGTFEVESFSGDDTYVVDLKEQTCTCLNFKEDRLPHAPPDHLGRWCKHLVQVLYDCGTMDELDEWRAALLADGFGGPLFAYFVMLPNAQKMVIGINSRMQWIDVYARSKKAGENMTNATGRIRRYGWHVSGHEWSYGEAPAGASELRPLLRSFDELYLIPKRPDSVPRESNVSRKAPIQERGCVTAVIVLFALTFLAFSAANIDI